MTHVTCRLTAKNRDQLRNPTLGIRVSMGYLFTYHHVKTDKVKFGAKFIATLHCTVHLQTAPVVLAYYNALCQDVQPFLTVNCRFRLKLNLRSECLLCFRSTFCSSVVCFCRLDFFLYRAKILGLFLKKVLTCFLWSGTLNPNPFEFESHRNFCNFSSGLMTRHDDDCIRINVHERGAFTPPPTSASRTLGLPRKIPSPTSAPVSNPNRDLTNLGQKSKGSPYSITEPFRS